MADVYEADDGQGREVAIKLLCPDLMQDSDAQNRFEREARIVESLKHPHVAQLIEHGQTSDKRPYLVMELVRGRTLSDIIQDRETVPHETVLMWLIQCAEALDEAWKSHVIHRDLKPANIMIDSNQSVKLLDFGLAKALHHDTDQSRERIVLGTPRYMSPEMGLGQSLDFRADMYSLGATFYHLLVGQSPFDADTPMGIIMKHAKTPLPSPRAIEPDLPADVDDILVHLLQKEPGQRYQSYSDLIADLKEARLAILSRNATPKRLPPKSAPIADAGVMKASASPPGWIYEPAFWMGLGVLLSFGFAIVRFYQITQSGAPKSLVTRRPAKLNTAALEQALEPGGALDLKENPEKINHERMTQITIQLLAYEIRHKRRPLDLRELAQSDEGRSLDIHDAWGREFLYDHESRLLSSTGEDGEAGTDDDYVLDEKLHRVSVVNGTAKRKLE